MSSNNSAPIMMIRSLHDLAFDGNDMRLVWNGAPDFDWHPASWPDVQLLNQCKLTFSRASGPGGQHRNKVETSVQIEYIPACIIASASECRTQKDNRKVAVQRLRCKLAVELRPTRNPISTAAISTALAAKMQMGSATWKQYCRNRRIDVSETNSDWPAILAEIVGFLSISDWNVSDVAVVLGTSSSQLVKLLKKHPPAFALLNQERKVRSQRPLE